MVATPVPNSSSAGASDAASFLNGVASQLEGQIAQMTQENVNLTSQAFTNLQVQANVDQAGTHGRQEVRQGDQESIQQNNEAENEGLRQNREGQSTRAQTRQGNAAERNATQLQKLQQGVQNRAAENKARDYTRPGLAQDNEAYQNAFLRPQRGDVERSNAFTNRLAQRATIRSAVQRNGERLRTLHQKRTQLFRMQRARRASQDEALNRRLNGDIENLEGEINDLESLLAEDGIPSELLGEDGEISNDAEDQVEQEFQGEGAEEGTRTETEDAVRRRGTESENEGDTEGDNQPSTENVPITQPQIGDIEYIESNSLFICTGDVPDGVDFEQMEAVQQGNYFLGGLRRGGMLCRGSGFRRVSQDWQRSSNPHDPDWLTAGDQGDVGDLGEQPGIFSGRAFAARTTEGESHLVLNRYQLQSALENHEGDTIPVRDGLGSVNRGYAEDRVAMARESLRVRCRGLFDANASPGCALVGMPA